MVHPDVGRLIDSNGVAIVGIDLGYLEIAENDILLLADVKPDSSNRYKGQNTSCRDRYLWN
jgi:hypothetical protein